MWKTFFGLVVFVIFSTEMVIFSLPVCMVYDEYYRSVVLFPIVYRSGSRRVMVFKVWKIIFSGIFWHYFYWKWMFRLWLCIKFIFKWICAMGIDLALIRDLWGNIRWVWLASKGCLPFEHLILPFQNLT